jgi:Na+/glutamate symporter
MILTDCACKLVAKNVLSLQTLVKFLREKVEIFVTAVGILPRFIIKKNSIGHNAVSLGATGPGTEYLCNITLFDWEQQDRVLSICAI